MTMMCFYVGFMFPLSTFTTPQYALCCAVELVGIALAEAPVCTESEAPETQHITDVSFF